VTRRPKSAFSPSLALSAVFTLAITALALLALAPAANASKQAVDFFGGDGNNQGRDGNFGGLFISPQSVAVNDTGAGPADAGDVYAIDSRCCQPPIDQSGNRIQRFGRDDNGTPADTADDTYFFISAWGADVVQSGGAGDSGDAAAKNYEICTVSSECQAAVASGGNGTPAGNGALDLTSFDAGAIAVDQDTGNVFVSDSVNNRVNVYDGVGAFLYSFGFDVDATTAGTGYEVCPATDVCKAGLPGAGAGQIGAGEGIAVSASDGNSATGTVFLADSANNRVNTYGLDGSGPDSIGSSAVFGEGFPSHVAIDSRGILYADNSTNNNQLERYDTLGVNAPIGFLAPIAVGVNERQQVTIDATSGTYRLTFNGETTVDLAFDALGREGGDGNIGPIDTVAEALRALPSIGPSGVDVSFGTSPYTITFQRDLGAKDVPQLLASNGAVPLFGGAGASVTTTIPGQPGLIGESTRGLAIDPDSDGGGADTDVLYAARGSVIQQFGPLNSPGLSAPPSAEDDRHNTNDVASSPRGIAVEPAAGRLYAASVGEAGSGVYVIDNTGPSPTASLNSCDNVTATSADCHAMIDPNGPPATRYHFEYSTDGVRWNSLPEVFLGTQQDPQAIDATLEPPPFGLSPNTLYHVRIVAVRKFATPVISNELTLTTDPSPPLAETAGAPVRTTTTAQLNGRVTPRNSATTYRFEYGTDQTYGQSTPVSPAGSGELTALVAEELTGLSPDTTYHYRLVAENGVGSPVTGADMTLRTLATEELPNQSDEFPGPPGSDRAWEQVSIAEASGNPVGVSQAFSDDGNRAAYQIFGGTPISTTGNFFSTYFSERTPGGWQTSLITPPRDQLVGSRWIGLFGPDDLSTMITLNVGFSTTGEDAIWRLGPAASPINVFQAFAPQELVGDVPFGVSGDGSRVVGFLRGGVLDPAYPAAAAAINVYGFGSATPQLLSLLPGNLVSPCGVPHTFAKQQGLQTHWVSEDGSLLYFSSQDTGPCAAPGVSGAPPAQLYLRDIGAGQTRLISAPPLSGPSCEAGLVKAIPGAAFFATASRLEPADSEPASCFGDSNDVYRYDTGAGSFDCVTCAIPGFDVDVDGDSPVQIAVAEDGSRLYFTTTKRLAPGAPPNGQRAIYRVKVPSGDLAYVAPIVGGNIGTAQDSVDLAPDGSTLIFSSDLAFLNPLGATTDNGGGLQYYRYDDADRSLICTSCPQNGSAPLDEVRPFLYALSQLGQPNKHVLSADGDTFAFATPTPLSGADQNTPAPGQNLDSGIDIYEWRDGRHLLITDGLTNWAVGAGNAGPSPEGISPSGRDVFFSANAQYTPDAPDANRRLYDARIGGGIFFPTAPPPCPLEVCQGTPRGAPDDPLPASAGFSGRGNVTQSVPRPRCPKGKRKVRRAGKVRCVPKRQKRAKHRANHNRRANR